MQEQDAVVLQVVLIFFQVKWTIQELKEINTLCFMQYISLLLAFGLEKSTFSLNYNEKNTLKVWNWHAVFLFSFLI